MGETAQCISQLSNGCLEVLFIDLLQYGKGKLIFSLFRCIQSFHILGTDRKIWPAVFLSNTFIPWGNIFSWYILEVLIDFYFLITVETNKFGKAGDFKEL